MDKVRFLCITVYFQADFLVGVFQLRRRDQVIPLYVGQVVHSLCFASLPLGLPVDMPQGQAHHAQEHQQRHQPHGQRDRRPLEAVLNLPVGYRRGDGGEKVTSRSSEAGWADAGRRGLAWPATPSAETTVEARPKRTLIKDFVAVAATVTGGTDAGVVVDPVLTGAAVEARVAGAFVDVDLTALAGKSRTAAAHAHATMDQAQTAISAGKRRALVHSLLTVESSEAAGTLAHVAAAIVLLPALAAVKAGVVGACQQAVLAVGALEIWGTFALVAALQICAYSSIPARVAVTLLHLQLAVDPGETRQTSAGITSLARVHAGGTVHTGMVMGAEVQVLVT